MATDAPEFEAETDHGTSTSEADDPCYQPRVGEEAAVKHTREVCKIAFPRVFQGLALASRRHDNLVNRFDLLAMASAFSCPRLLTHNLVYLRPTCSIQEW